MCLLNETQKEWFVSHGFFCLFGGEIRFFGKKKEARIIPRICASLILTNLGEHTMHNRNLQPQKVITVKLEFEVSVAVDGNPEELTVELLGIDDISISEWSVENFIETVEQEIDDNHLEELADLLEANQNSYNEELAEEAA